MGLHVNQLIHDYGCLFVFVFCFGQAIGLPLPGTTALVAAALYSAGHHTLPIEAVIACAAAGAFLGTSGGYLIGRLGGPPLLERVGRRLRQPPERVARWRRAFAHSAGRFLFLGRFVSGVRNVVGLFAGASGMPWRRFVPICAAAAGAWALINGLEYYWFGRAVENAATWVQVLLVLVGLLWLGFTVRHMRRRLLSTT